QLAVQGVEFDPEALWADHRPPAAPPTESRSRSVTTLTGASYGKPYPPPGGAAELPPPNPEAPHPEADALPMEAPPAWEPPPVPQAQPGEQVSMAAAPSPAPVAAPSPGVSGPTEPRPAAAPVGIEAQWLDTFRQLQQRTAEAQGAYLSTMAEVQAAFLRVAEGSYAGLTAALTGQPVTSPPPPRSGEPAVAAGPLPPLPARSQPDGYAEPMALTPVLSPSAPYEPNGSPWSGLSAWTEPNGGPVSGPSTWTEPNGGPLSGPSTRHEPNGAPVSRPSAWNEPNGAPVSESSAWTEPNGGPLSGPSTRHEPNEAPGSRPPARDEPNGEPGCGFAAAGAGGQREVAL